MYGTIKKLFCVCLFGGTFTGISDDIRSNFFFILALPRGVNYGSCNTGRLSW